MSTPDANTSWSGRGARLLVGVSLIVGASAQTACHNADNDPLRPMNRAFFHMNMGVDRYIAQPVSKAYRSTVPTPMRAGLHNFFTNIASAPTILYDFMQGHPLKGLGDTSRLLLNSTFGLAGFFDPATRLGFPHHEETFGVTMGVWGIPQGPYLVLPILGPTTIADLPDIPIRILLSPFTYTNPYIITTSTGAGAVDTATERRNAIDRVRNAVDPYEYMRSAYLQHQEELIRRQKAKNKGEEIFPFEELPPDEDVTDKPAPAPPPDNDEPPPDESSSKDTPKQADAPSSPSQRTHPR